MTRLSGDDDVRRFAPRWLGPVELPWPFHARYLAWALWLGLFVTVLVLQVLLPLVNLSLPWAFTWAFLATLILMTLVDPERPLRSLWRPLLSDLTGPRAPTDKQYRRRTCTAQTAVTRRNDE